MFGAYSLSRRFVSLVLPFSTLSIGVALTRYLAVSDQVGKGTTYLFGSFGIILLSSAILGLVAWMGDGPLTILVFGTDQHRLLFQYSLLLIFSFGFYTVLYSYYRGILRMDLANIIQLILIGGLPLGISYFLADTGTAASIVLYIALGTFLCLIPLGWVMFRSLHLHARLVSGNHLMELIRYGIPRTPGGIALAGLLFVGPYLATSSGNIAGAGHLVVGQSVFRILEASIVAFGLVALPRVSQLFSEGRIEFLKDRISDIITMIIHLGLFAIVELFFWSELIVKVWLGEEYLTSVPIIQIYLIALCPYLGYVMLRSVVDAVEEKAINTINLFIALALTVISSLLLFKTELNILGLALGGSIGFMYLGISTAVYLMRKYRISLDYRQMAVVVAANAGCLVIALIVKNTFATDGDLIWGVTSFIISGSISFMLYLVFLFKLKVGWISELKMRIIPATDGSQ